MHRSQDHPVLQIWDMARFLLNSKYSHKLLGCDITDDAGWKAEVLGFWEKFRADTQICHRESLGIVSLDGFFLGTLCVRPPKFSPS